MEKVDIEEFIKEELEKEAQDIERRIKALPEKDGMPVGTKEKIRGNLREQIQEYELKKRYPDMSEEDRRALCLGRELLKREADEKVKMANQENEEESEAIEIETGTGEAPAGSENAPEGLGKVIHRRKRGKFYLGLAAVFVLACAIGVTSLGGPTRIVKFLKGVVGDREVVKVNSGEDKLVIIEESEEEAYELIEEEFGVRPVRVMSGLQEKQFQFMEFDKTLQLAELTYSYGEEKIIYYISASFQDSSWGVDIEDESINKYEIETKGCLIEVKEYETKESKVKKCSANFRYKGIEYFLIGTMGQEEFKVILDNLYFFH